jgi:hypothetical protein
MRISTAVRMRHRFFIRKEEMVSFSLYKTLPRETQIDLLLEFGVYLDLVRESPQLSIELYALGSFYVEIYFNTLSDDPFFVRAFDSMVELEPYLPMVEIKRVLEMK